MPSGGRASAATRTSSAAASSCGRRSTRSSGSCPRVQFPSGVRLWAPQQSLYDADHSDRRYKYRGRRFLPVVGRLRPGVSLAQAQQEADSLAAGLEREHADTNQGVRFRLQPLREAEIGAVRSYLLSLYGAVGFVLLIGCTNVTNLLLVRAAAREREMGVRAGGARGGPLAPPPAVADRERPARRARTSITGRSSSSGPGTGASCTLAQHWMRRVRLHRRAESDQSHPWPAGRERR